MPIDYPLQWTTDDFDRLEWHDATIRAVGITSDPWELFLDIDYILEWICPIPPDTQFQFQVAPATLVFENVAKIKIDLDLHSYSEITLNRIWRENLNRLSGELTIWDWILESHQGRITFQSTGFKQFVRSPQKLASSQGLSLAERGGLSFGRPS
jgi:hypothetical protein